MKAYSVYPGDSPHDSGCVLVFAENRNKAIYYAMRLGFWDDEYIDYKAYRFPEYDNLAKGKTEPFEIDCNEDLPKEYKPFYDDTI